MTTNRSSDGAATALTRFEKLALELATCPARLDARAGTRTCRAHHVDADTRDFRPQLAYGVLGPIMEVPGVRFVKAAFHYGVGH